MFFRPKGHLSLKTDIHSHLIPGVDDGVTTVDEAISLIKEFKELGYSRLITTPHISESYYPNSIQFLRERHQALMEALIEKDITIKIDLGAEYMVDGMFLNTLKNGEELLTWNNHILIETSFHSLPWILDEVIFEIQSRNLIPVLAHPERYPYFVNDQSKVEELRLKGIKMQVTIGSLVGQYGSIEKKMARYFLASGWVDFLGSDVHNTRHINLFKKGLRHRIIRNVSPDQFSNQRLT